MLVLALSFILVMVLVASLMAALGVWIGWALLTGFVAGAAWALVFDNLSTKFKRRNADQERENEGYVARNSVPGYRRAPRDAH